MGLLCATEPTISLLCDRSCRLAAPSGKSRKLCRGERATASCDLMAQSEPRADRRFRSITAGVPFYDKQAGSLMSCY